MKYNCDSSKDLIFQPTAIINQNYHDSYDRNYMRSRLKRIKNV